MDLNDRIFKEEISSFFSSIQKLLPRRKEVVYIKPLRPRLTKLSDVHVEAKSVFPKCFVGARLIILREVMDRIKLVQQYNYGKPKETRHFSHMIHKEMEAKLPGDGLVLDTSGAATATYTEHIGGFDMTLTSKIKNLVASETELEFEREYKKASGSFTCAVKDVDPTTLKLVTQWMYRIFPDFSFGMEVGCRPLSYPLRADMSASVRYERPSYTLSSTISKSGFQVCLFKQFAPDLRISTIIHEGDRYSTANISIGMHKEYDHGSEVKIFVDSQQCGGFTYQKDIFFNHPEDDLRVVKIVWSTILDRQHRVRFGFGFNLDF